MAASELQQRRVHAQAMKACQAGDFATAAALLDRLVRAGRRRDHNLLYMLGMAQVHSGDHRSGRRNLQKAIEIAPGHAHYHAQLAIAHQRDGDLEEALRCVERGLRAQPDHPNALVTKADLLWLKGQYREAYDLIRPHADRCGADPGLVIRSGRLAGRLEGPGPGIELLERLLERPDLAAFHRATALFRLGELLDRAARYDEAFEAFARGNELLRQPFDAASHEEAVARLVASWSKRDLALLARARVRSPKPVLIVGMMRSGTTLVEQILAAHPQVAAGGELPVLGDLAAGVLGSAGRDVWAGIRYRAPATEALDAAARTYLQVLGKIGPSALRVTDKAPHNYILLGLVSLLLPEARVVHCTRDPLDTCISCFFQDLRPHQHPAAADLEALGAYYRHYRVIMEHWRAVLDVPVLDFSYERLVAGQEPATRELLAFVGLEWDDACLRFHEGRRAAVTMSSEQVRRPLYDSSVGRWRHYDRHLGPLRAALGEPAGAGA